MGSRLQTIAKVIFALAFVAILAVMNSGILTLGSNSNKKLNTTLNMTDGFELSTFDNTSVTGDTVISSIKNCKTLSSSTKIKVTVVTKGGGATVYGYADTKADVFTDYTESDPRDNDFINPTADFTSVLEKNSNEIVIGIKFTQK